MQKKSKYPRISFKIGNCSSQDPDCPASELLLQTPSCKGWQSGRYCSYPQVVSLQLPQFFMITQITLLAHQYKIPSRVQVDYLIPQQQQYKRLGHFSMGNNMESNFQVRQLKNIPVSINSNEVRFTMHKNHINKYNVFNQIGVISICLYGVPYQSIPKTISSKNQYKQQVQKPQNNPFRLIQELEAEKKDAIANQDYETAGRIKNKIQNIKKVQQQLQDLQTRKQLAVKKEDFETAKILHQQIIRIKTGAQRQDMRATAAKQQTRQQYQPPSQVREQQCKQQQSQNYYQPPPKKKPQPVRTNAPQQPTQKTILNVDDIPINVKKTNIYQNATGQEQQQKQKQKQQNAPKKLQNLKGEQLSISQPYFDILDKQVFMKIFSKHHSFRQQGINDIRQALDSQNGNKNNLAKAAFLIVKILLDDKIVTIIFQALDLFHYTLERLNPKFNDPNIDSILNKVSDFTGHTNQKVRQQSWDLIRQLPHYEITNKNVCIKALSHIDGKKSPKIIGGRLESLRKLIQDYGVGDYLQQCAMFAVKYIEDKSNQVRCASIQLIKALINQAGSQNVMSYLKNLRPAILKQIQDSSQRQQIPSNRQQVPIKRKTSQSKRVQEQAPKPVRKMKPQQPPADQCPYCLKRDPQFENQDYRDIHLYNTCAMLMLCECQQAIEVSSLSSHLTSQCKNSKYYKKCPRCKQAVHQSKYKSHVESKQCNSAKPLAVANRCPLCHQDISPGIGGWKQHLVDEGCPNHSR